MELQLLNSKKKVALTDAIFANEYNEPLVHQVVTAYLAAARSGTRAQKTRAEVRGGGVKPWKQKGTGRARAGTIRSPIWRKGGVTFAAKPQCFKQKVNKKMYRGAILSILSELVRQDRLSIVDKIQLDKPKTKDLLKQFASWKLDVRNILIITDSVDENLYLSARNIPHLEILDVVAASSDPVAFVRAEKVIITEEAVKKLEEVLA